MDVVNAASKTVEDTLGVSAGVAQVIAWFAILAVAYLALQVVQGFFLKKKKLKRGDLLLILGQCGSGKTALYYQLKDSEEAGEVKLVSSLTPNRAKLQIKAGGLEKAIDTIDYPGHQRFRGRQAELYKEARCIVYLVDSEDKQKLKDAAEHLYEILTSHEVIEINIPILLACNKSDLSGARTEKFIIEEIEREMEQMRTSRAATLEGQDQADSYLGVDGEKFKLIEHSPCPIEVCRISTKKPDLGSLYDYLQQQFA